LSVSDLTTGNYAHPTRPSADKYLPTTNLTRPHEQDDSPLGDADQHSDGVARSPRGAM